MFFLVYVLFRAREDEADETEKEASINAQNMKDDIARLLHLFKEPVAQVHWSNLYGVLNRAELDARRTEGPLSDAANALSCLVEIFKNYESFARRTSWLNMFLQVEISARSRELHLLPALKNGQYLLMKCMTSSQQT